MKTYERTSATVKAWLITHECAETQGRIIEDSPDFPRGWKIIAQHHHDQGEKRLRVSGPPTNAEGYAPRFFLLPGNYLVVGNNALSRWPAPLFNMAHRRITDA